MSATYSLPTIGGIFAASDHQRFLVEPGRQSFDDLFPRTIRGATRNLYETGVDALAAILKECSPKDSPVRLWTADNFCRESLQRLSIKLDHRIELHDFRHTNELTRLEPDDVLLYLHFNCYDPTAAEIIERLRRDTGATVIEDFVQAPLDISRFTADYALNSLRKFSSLDVAIAYQRTAETRPAQSSRYRILRKEAEQAKSRFLQHPTTELEQLFLRLGREADEALAVREITAAHPDEVEKGIAFDFRTVRASRQSNHEFLKQRFRSEFPDLKVLPGEYMYLMIDTADRERYRKHLFSKRIFPVVHWADSGSAQSKTILSFHIDQRYTPEDLERVVTEIAEVRSILTADLRSEELS